MRHLGITFGSIEGSCGGEVGVGVPLDCFGGLLRPEGSHGHGMEGSLGFVRLLVGDRLLCVLDFLTFTFWLFSFPCLGFVHYISCF